MAPATADNDLDLPCARLPPHLRSGNAVRHTEIITAIGTFFSLLLDHKFRIGVPSDPSSVCSARS
jgi:hypothetical protein